MITLEHGKHLIGPTPWGEPLHLNQPLDEITLLRLITGMRECGLDPEMVLEAKVWETWIAFEVIDCPPVWTNDGDIERRTFIAFA